MPAPIKYTKEMLRAAIAESTSYAGVLRHLGVRPGGWSHAYIKLRCEQFGLDTSRLTGHRYVDGHVPAHRKPASQILTRRPQGSRRPHLDQLRRALGEIGVARACSLCGLEPSWRGQPLTLEIDHEDGDWLNNLPENLRYLCPNCHSQQVTNRPWKNGRGA